MSKDAEQTVNSREAAAMLGVSYPTFRRRVENDEIKPVTPSNPALKKPQGERFRVADVEALKSPKK